VRCYGQSVGRVIFFTAFGAATLLTAVAGCGSTSASAGVADGASITPAADAGICTERYVQASNYDQTCRVDIDCRVIDEGNVCTPCEFNCGGTAAINAGALTKYLSDIANTPAVLAAADGGCPACQVASGNGNFGPFCCAGKCHIGSQCPDDGAACGVAGGQCIPGACASGEHAEAQGCGDGSNCCLHHSDAGPLCAATGCIATCVSGAHNVLTMVDGCYVWQCCVPD
jgi:hypothetical protein